MKKLKIDRIISIATLIASLVAIVLVLRKPTPVAPKQAPAAIAEHAQSFDQKMAQFELSRRRLKYTSTRMKLVQCWRNRWVMLERL